MTQQDQQAQLAPPERGGNVVRSFAILFCISVLMWAVIIAAVVAR